MEYLLTALTIFILGCVIHLESRVSSIDTIVRRLDKNSTGKKKRKGVETEDNNGAKS